MLPGPFEHHRPSAPGEAVCLLSSLGDEARVPAGDCDAVPEPGTCLSVDVHCGEVGGPLGVTLQDQVTITETDDENPTNNPSAPARWPEHWRKQPSRPNQRTLSGGSNPPTTPLLTRAQRQPEGIALPQRGVPEVQRRRRCRRKAAHSNPSLALDQFGSGFRGKECRPVLGPCRARAGSRRLPRAAPAHLLFVMPDAQPLGRAPAKR